MSNTLTEQRQVMRAKSIAPVPHKMLQVPLWAEPAEAHALDIRTWSYNGWHMVVRGALGRRGPDLDGEGKPQFDKNGKIKLIRPQHSSAGVLSYNDLDVLLSLFHYWETKGREKNGEISVTMPDVLRWMGFDRLAGAPYIELNCSLKRLSQCQFAIAHRDEVTDGNIDETLSEKLGSLLSSFTVTKPERRGQEAVIDATLSPHVIEWLSTSFQEIDLDIYAYLVKHKSTRRLPLARVLYVYLNKWRQKDGTFSIPEGWITSLYADRKQSIDGSPGKLIYRDGFRKDSKLSRALKGLSDAGVISIRRDKPRIIGRVHMPANLKRLRDQPRQGRFVEIDFKAVAYAAEQGQKEPAPQITNSAPPPQTGDARYFHKVSEVVRVNKNVVNSALDGEWSKAEITRLFVVAYVTANNPEAWAANILRNGYPDGWTASKIKQKYDSEEIATALKRMLE